MARGTDRRSFLKISAAAGGAVGLNVLPRVANALERSVAQATRQPTARASVPLNILILGGTGFTGPEQVEYALARGHKVTLLNRNKPASRFLQGTRRSARWRPERRRQRARRKEVRRRDRQSDDLPRLGAQRGAVSQGQHGAVHLHLDDLRLPRRQPAEQGRERQDDADARGSRPVHAGAAERRTSTTARSRASPSRKCSGSIRASAPSCAPA